MGHRKLRIAFVVPRYAVGSAGGAEVLAKGLAEKSRDAGYEIEVFTTCARDHIRWENYFEAGVEEINGIAVRRFKVNENRDFEKYLEIQERIIKYEELSLDEEKGWISESVNSEELYRHIDRERVNFDCFVFIPYMFGTTYWGAQIVSDKAVLIPCLHDEPYAEMDIFQELFDNVKGVIFNTVPEMELGKRIYGFPESKAAVVGMGFDDRGGYRPEDFRKKFRIREPFVLYAGRREGGKNTDLLVEYFRLYKTHNRNSLKLVFIGTGEVKLNPIDRKYIVDLGFISDEDKDNAYSAALFFCQPSLNESLSIVLMESWLAGRPVLVNSGCAVTTEHCRRSDGGLMFGDYYEFEEVLNLFLGQPELCHRLGENGKNYVKREYNWNRTLERFEKALAKFGFL